METNAFDGIFQTENEINSSKHIENTDQKCQFKMKTPKTIKSLMRSLIHTQIRMCAMRVCVVISFLYGCNKCYYLFMYHNT